MLYPSPLESRAEIITGALIYLMSSYRRTPCPRLAQCVACHLECLSRHPDADPVIREFCAGMVDEWRNAARAIATPAAQERPLAECNLH
jgi:hypothetical protein